MGKPRGYKPKRNFAEKRRERQNDKVDWAKVPHRAYATIIRENADFEAYYKAQNLVPETEWELFIKNLKENLPVAFRITGYKAETKALLEIIKGDFFKEIINLVPENRQGNVSIEIKPHCLPFYPDDLGWQLQLTRKDIRRSEAFFKLHNFLIAETNSGNISRQEVVSMIPPLVLDVKPWHKVLDMCAAPGSKTTQLIEMIHSDEKIPNPEGFVVANDLDNNRCYMLVHQAKRLNSPNILITNHDSSVMPNFFVTQSDKSKIILKFDRILADVPCSGDGTLRKNPDIWHKWSPANGNNLHGIQYRIAKRGAELLNIGGKMVYSTCSLNPIENEAVLYRLLLETGDSMKLVECQSLVPGLIFRPGLSYWRPSSKNLEYFDTWDDVPIELHTQIRPHMFPPKPEDAEKFNLHKCMRILPHHQNTGGFFVAVIEKVKTLPWEIENDQKLILEDNKKTFIHQKKRKKTQGFKEDPFVFFKNEEEIWPSIREFYDVSNDFNPQCLLVRCYEGKKKNIYFTSPAIRNLVISNKDDVKIINTGVKSFVRCDNKNMKCAFRLAQEGLSSIAHFIGHSRKVKVSKNDLVMLLQNNNHHNPPEISKLSTATQEKLKNLAKGSCILIYEDDQEKKNPFKLEMVGWRGVISLRAYVSVHDAIHYLHLLGADCSMFERNKFQENRELETFKIEETMNYFSDNEDITTINHKSN